MSQIARLIGQLSGTTTPVLKACIVTAVDRTSRSIDCEPLDESAPILGCSLQGDQEGEEGFLLLPKVGSYVIVGLVDGQDTGAVLLTDTLEALELKIGDKTLHFTSEGIVFNGGDLGGLIKVEELTTKLNTIERDINSLKQAISTWTPIPSDGGAALKAAITSWAGKQLQQSRRGDYEDPNVKH